MRNLTLYVDDLSISRRDGKIVLGSCDDIPESCADDLGRDAVMVFDGRVIDVRGWTEEQREAVGVYDSRCDEWWEGKMRLATPEEVLTVFFGEVPRG